MDAEIGLAQTAAVLCEGARIKMLWSLMAGEERPASELAFLANVSAQSASSHLSKLTEAKMIIARYIGRHRYYRIASPEVAQAVEAIAALAPQRRPQTRIENRSPAMRMARTCYDHLAGKLAVQIAEAMERNGYVVSGEDISVTDNGLDWLKNTFSIDLAKGKPRRPAVKKCLDWSERQYHLAGVLGSELLTELQQRGWIARSDEPRIMRVTLLGRRKLAELFGISV